MGPRKRRVAQRATGTNLAAVPLLRAPAVTKPSPAACTLAPGPIRKRRPRFVL
jgi:hypothetical protein